MKKETILVTGGAGYLGSHLVRRLLKEGFDVLVAKRSFSSMARLEPIPEGVRFFDLDQTDLEAVFSRDRIETVIHCATDYGRKPVADTSKAERLFGWKPKVTAQEGVGKMVEWMKTVGPTSNFSGAILK